MTWPAAYVPTRAEILTRLRDARPLEHRERRQMLSALPIVARFYGPGPDFLDREAVIDALETHRDIRE